MEGEEVGRAEIGRSGTAEGGRDREGSGSWEGEVIEG